MDQFISYEVQPVRDLGEECCVCQEEEATFWSIYGRLAPNQDGHKLAVCIGDFNSRETAETVMGLIERSR